MPRPQARRSFALYSFADVEENFPLTRPPRSCSIFARGETRKYLPNSDRVVVISSSFLRKSSRSPKGKGRASRRPPHSMDERLYLLRLNIL